MPKKPKRPCGRAGCPKFAVDGSQYCAKHKAEENRNYNRYTRNGQNVKIYSGKRWRAVRRQYYQAHPLCEDCLLEGRTTSAEEVALYPYYQTFPENGTLRRAVFQSYSPIGE